MKVNFLVAEEIRPEADGKVTVIGLFVGDIIVMDKRNRPEGLPEGLPEGIERLTILAIISDASEGIHRFKGAILDPLGEVSKPNASLGEADIEKGNCHVVAINIKPFVVKKPGIFRLEFFVDDEAFYFPFEIREQLQ